jgi:phospholipase/carboxylesterase
MKNNSPVLMGEGTAVTVSGLVHRVLEPETTRPRPTVVMLHGRSGDEDVMWVFARSLPPEWLLVAPRAIKSDPEGGYSWQPRQRDEWPSLNAFDEAVTALVRFINALPELYQADPNQIYLMGFSQGAALAFATAFHYPELVQGIAGLVGFVPVENGQPMAQRPLANMPVYMAVGREDELIPLAVSQRCASVLREAGAELSYNEYDSGHRLNAEAMRDLRAWWQARQEALTTRQ